MKIVPIEDRVVVKPDTAEEVSKGGIYIPEAAREKPNKGTVVEVGETKLVQVGDRILYPKGLGTLVTLDGADYLIMREPDIFAVI